MKVNSNWMKLKQKVDDGNNKRSSSSSTRNQSSRRINESLNSHVNDVIKMSPTLPLPNDEHKYLPLCIKSMKPVSQKIKLKYVALDCEMVGVGDKGRQNALARCCLVDFDGNKVYDEFVRPPAFVTDFRTKWSGIRKGDLRHGNAVPLNECISAVAKLIKDKLLVGHALKNDLDVLMLSHPRKMIRDTANYRPLMRSHGHLGKFRPRALRDLSKEHLEQTIQTGEHDPGEDARAAMMLYRKYMDVWEDSLRQAKANAFTKSSTNIKANDLNKTISSTSSSSQMGGDIDADEDENEDEDEAKSADDDDESENSNDNHDTSTNKRKRISSSTDDKESSTHGHGNEEVEGEKKAKRTESHKPQSMFASCSYDANGKPLKSISSVTSSLPSSSSSSKSKHTSYREYQNRKNKFKKR